MNERVIKGGFSGTIQRKAGSRLLSDSNENHEKYEKTPL